MNKGLSLKEMQDVNFGTRLSACLIDGVHLIVGLLIKIEVSLLHNLSQWKTNFAVKNEGVLNKKKMQNGFAIRYNKQLIATGKKKCWSRSQVIESNWSDYGVSSLQVLHKCFDNSNLISTTQLRIIIIIGTFINPIQ